MDQTAPTLREDIAVIPLAEEFARVEKRLVETGRVRVVLSTESRDEVLTETLRRDGVEVERVAVDRVLAEGEPVPLPRHEADGSYVVPVVEEVLFVERRLVLREEVRLRPRAAEEAVQHRVTLRRQRADIARDPA